MADFDQVLEAIRGRSGDTEGLTGLAATTPSLRQPPMDFVGRNQRQGVPLHVDKHFPVPVIAGTYFRRDPLDQEEYLRGKGYSVRRADTGELILGYRTEEGGEEEAILNPRGVSREDIAQFVLGTGAEAVGGLLALKGGRAPGLWPLIKGSVLGAAGAQTAGGVQDVAGRIGSERGIRFSEIAEHRAKLGALELGFAAGLGAFPKIAGRLVSPFNNRGPIQFESEAAEAWMRQQGFLAEDFVRTPAHKTGSTMMAQIEATFGRLPGARTVFDDLDEKAIEQLNNLRDIAIGNTRVSRAQAGGRAIELIGAKTFPEERAASQAASETLRAGTKELAQEALAITGVRGALAGDKLDRVMAGQHIRHQLVERRDAFQSYFRGEYGALETEPLLAEKTLSLKGTSQQAKELRETFPSYLVEETEEAAIIGGPSVTIERKKVLPEFVPAKVRRFVNVLIEGKDQQMTLQELLAMRREIRNSISEAKAIPGVETHYLDKLNGMLTDTITTELKDLDAREGTALFGRWKKINDDYAVRVRPFERQGIAELFRRPEHPPYIGDSAVVSRATRSNPQASDIYRAYEEFFGSNSPEIRMVQRAIVDDVMGIVDVSTGLVDAPSVLRRLSELYDTSPDVAHRLFGEHGGRFARIAEEMGVVTGKVDADKLLMLMAEPGPTTAKMTAFMAQQDKLNAAYSNPIIRAAAKGTPFDQKINPHEFVGRLINFKKTTPEQVKQVMQALSGDPVVNDIRALTAKDIFDRASGLVRGKRTFSSQEIQTLLYGDPDREAIYKTVLGPDRFAMIDKIAKLAMGRQHLDPIITGGGGLAGPQQIAAGFRTPGSTLLRSASQFMFSIIYTDPAFTKLISNTAVNPATTAAMANYLIASTPFLVALHRVAGERAEEVMEDLKAGIDERATTEAGMEAYNQRFQTVLDGIRDR